MEENLQQPTQDYTASPAFIQMVRKMASDMKFVGIFSIIYGAITCLGIVSALIGVPTIIAGIRLKEASDLFRNYITNGDYASLAAALEKQGRFFNIAKILIIVGLVLTFLYIVVIIALIASGIFPPFKGSTIS